MHCDNCGNLISTVSVFCDSCGQKIGEQNVILNSVKRKFNFLKFIKIPRHQIEMGIIFLLFSIGAIVAYNFYEKQQHSLNQALKTQQQETSQIAAQLTKVKEDTEATTKQNLDPIQTLSSQLAAQKSETDDAKQQAALAEKALSIISKQPAAVSASDSFPHINSQAIVLILCQDASGNIDEGSGTIVDSSGYILTNKHVVTDSYGNFLTCVAYMNDGSSLATIQNNVYYTLSTSAPNTGLYANANAAIIQIVGAINSQTNTTLSLPTSFPYITPQPGNIKQGDSVFIFGYPSTIINYVFNATKGAFSSRSADGTYINTDAMIDHGN